MNDYGTSVSSGSNCCTSHALCCLTLFLAAFVDQPCIDSKGGEACMQAAITAFLANLPVSVAAQELLRGC
jgi:hypothetical protein